MPYVLTLLSRSTNLTMLDLSHNHFSPNGAPLLSQIFNFNSSLTWLSLESCYFGREGARALAQASFPTGFRQLDLRDNNIRSEMFTLPSTIRWVVTGLTPNDDDDE